MVKKEAKQAEARKLYLEGYSYNNIANILKVSKGSLSLWCKDIVRKVISKKSNIKPFMGELPYNNHRVSVSSVKQGHLYYKLKNIDTGNTFYLSQNRYTMAVHLGRILSNSEVVVIDPDSPVYLKVVDKSIWYKTKNEKAARTNNKKKGFMGEHPYTDYYLYEFTSSGALYYIAVHNVTRVRICLPKYKYIMATHLKRFLTDDEVVVPVTRGIYDVNNLVLKTKQQIKNECIDSHKSTCEFCKKEFIKNRNEIRFCSIKCAAMFRGQLISKRYKTSVACKVCNRFFTPQSTSGKLCRSCKIVANRNTIKKIKYYHECVVCEKEFQSFNKEDEVCFSKKCMDVINSYTD